MEDTTATKISKRPFIVALRKQGYTFEKATNLYNTFMNTLIAEIMSGKEVSLTGFGSFTLKHHKGHPVSFKGSKETVNDYLTLKFSASHTFSKRLRNDKRLIELIKERDAQKAAKE